PNLQCEGRHLPVSLHRKTKPCIWRPRTLMHTTRPPPLPNTTRSNQTSTLSLHDALPIYVGERAAERAEDRQRGTMTRVAGDDRRSEEHTSELQSRFELVCRLLLEKKKMNELVVCADVSLLRTLRG